MSISFLIPGGNVPAQTSSEKPQDTQRSFVCFFFLSLLPELIIFLHVYKDPGMPAICEILHFHDSRLDICQVAFTWTMTADNALWIFPLHKGQRTFPTHLPVSLLPCSLQISPWLFSAVSSAYVRNCFCMWYRLKLLNSDTWKLPLKIGEIGNALPSSSMLLKALSYIQFMAPHWNAKLSAARSGCMSEAL